MNPGDILVRPIITERSTMLHTQGKYIFQISKRATKPQVKQAVEQAFNVKVLAVNTNKLPGKRKRMGPRLVHTPTVRKAVVTLRTGDKIQLFEGL